MLYELLNMEEWKTKNILLEELEKIGVFMTERQLRNAIIRHNKLYMQHESDLYIAHSKKGYKVTTNCEEIKASVNDNRKRAIKMLVDNSKILKTLGENSNLNLIIENGELKERRFFNEKRID